MQKCRILHSFTFVFVAAGIVFFFFVHFLELVFIGTDTDELPALYVCLLLFFFCGGQTIVDNSGHTS